MSLFPQQIRQCIGQYCSDKAGHDIEIPRDNSKALAGRVGQPAADQSFSERTMGPAWEEGNSSMEDTQSDVSLISPCLCFAYRVNPTGLI